MLEWYIDGEGGIERKMQNVTFPIVARRASFSSIYRGKNDDRVLRARTREQVLARGEGWSKTAGKMM